MSEAIYFLALNLLTLVGFGIAFFAMYRKEPRLKHALYFSYAYFHCAAAFAIDIFAPPNIGGFLGSSVSYLFFSFAIYTMVQGVFLRYNKPFPVKTVASLLASGQMLMMVIMILHSVALGRVTFSFLMAPIFAISLIAAASRRSEALDKFVLIVLAFGAFIMTVHPTMIGLTIGFSDTFGAYSESIHAFAIYFSVALLSLPLGAVLLFATAMEIFTKLHSKAITDGLSGLLNRASFEQQTKETIKEHANTNNPVSLIVCDIDHFKMINDTMGHAAGDEVIRKISACLKNGCRGSDLVGRVGGEEFCILLPTATSEMGSLVAKNLRSQIALTGLKNGRRAVTVSMGLATLEEGEDYQSLFNRADEALYMAKNTGRDRVCIAEDTSTFSANTGDEKVPATPAMRAANSA